MIIKVLILGRLGEPSCHDLLKMINFFSCLWKIDYSFFDPCGKKNVELVEKDWSHVIISYGNTDQQFENQCADYLTAQKNASILLFDTTEKVYGQKFVDFFGINGICSAVSGQRVVSIVHADPITRGLYLPIGITNLPETDSSAIINRKAEALLTDNKANILLTKHNRTYCLSVPVWQIGVPTFPSLTELLRNFFYFNEEIGHFSPFPYVSLRIDDYPLTSGQYLTSGGVLDDMRADETAMLCDWSQYFDARLEFMVSSHIMGKDGLLRSLDEVAPKSCITLQKYFQQGIININAHGRSHIDEERYQIAGDISPMEFSRLNERDTEEHLEDCIVFIRRFFSKESTGFVPPSWSYHEEITKQVCQRRFKYVADSSKNFRKGKNCLPLGKVDASGMTHILETWHLGSPFFNYLTPSLWHSFIRCGVPIHMMSHGPYLADPLPAGIVQRPLAIFLFLLIAPVLIPFYPLDFWRGFKGLLSPVKWARLGLIRKFFARLPYFRRASLRHLLFTGAQHNVTWAFTDTLAEHLYEYSMLQLVDYKREKKIHTIRIHLQKYCHGPFLFHLPHPVEQVEIDGITVPIKNGTRTAFLMDLEAGDHVLTARTC